LAAAVAVLFLTASPSLASPAPDPQGRSDVAADSGVRVVTRLFR